MYHCLLQLRNVPVRIHECTVIGEGQCVHVRTRTQVRLCVPTTPPFMSHAMCMCAHTRAHVCTHTNTHV